LQNRRYQNLHKMVVARAAGSKAKTAPQPAMAGKIRVFGGATAMPHGALISVPSMPEPGGALARRLSRHK